MAQLLPGMSPDNFSDRKLDIARLRFHNAVSTKFLLLQRRDQMALIRWEPARELGTIQNEMNRLFNSFFDTPTPTGNGALRRWIPAMDLVETEDDFVLRADLPGLSEQDVNIEFEDNVLTISGERKAHHEERKEGYYRVERAFGNFSRSLTLPGGVNAAAGR